MKKFFIVIAAAFHLVSLSFAENIIFKADFMSGKSSEKKDYAKLTGNASIITSTMEIYADVIELSGENYRFIEATGNVSGTNVKNKIDFTCGQLLYDRETEIATLQNSVHLIDRENETIANAEIMDYDQNKSTIIMQISVAMQQKDNICVGSHAIYKTDARTLFLSGNPQITKGKDVFRAQEIELNLDTQDIILDGRVRGSVEETKNNE
ncbi:MAG: organic solvent tolerance protein OstA [Treponema sp.]|nr:organic solvent tolerance protein OstA [Treponema sp.]